MHRVAHRIGVAGFGDRRGVTESDVGRRLFAVITLVVACLSGAAWITYGYETYDNLLLAKMGIAEILRYLEGSDRGKNLTEEQIAAKYILGEIPKNEEPPARSALLWKSLPLSEQRQLKVVWFREHYREVPVDEVNKFVNLDYLRARVEAEFRDNPLASAQEAARVRADVIARMENKYKAYNKGRAAKGLKAIKSVITQADTPVAAPKKEPREHAARVKKKSDTEVVTVAKKPAGPKSVAAPEKKPKEVARSAVRPDTSGGPPTVNGAIKKLPWYGIPNKMKNE